MKTFSEKYENLVGEIKNKLHDLIKKYKIEQEHSSNFCLPVINKDFKFNLEGDRHLIEVTNETLIDNEGYTYQHCQLDVENYMELVDYLFRVYP